MNTSTTAATGMAIITKTLIVMLWRATTTGTNPTYVQDWIDQDVTRDEERRPIIRQMLARAPFDRESAVRVLDVGAGYGLLSHEVLEAYSKAHVTLQDYSGPMLERARERLAAYTDRVTFVVADFSRPGWTKALGGPFDFAVSGIAIHNLGDPEAMQSVYGEVAGVIKPRGVFLDMDYIFRGLTPEMHAQWLQEAGFSEVEVLWRDERRASFAAFK